MTTHIRRCRMCGVLSGQYITCDACNFRAIFDDKIQVDKQPESEKEGE
jgi:hypothetical protein